MNIKKNSFTLIEILIGAGIFVLVASISTAIFGYTIYSRNKTQQQNQISQTAKNVLDEIGSLIRDPNSTKIRICGQDYFNNVGQNFEISSGELLGHRKVGNDLRILKNGVVYIFTPNFNYVTNTPNSSYDVLKIIINNDPTAINCPLPPSGSLLNSSDVRLSRRNHDNTGGLIKQAAGDIPYLAFMGCDDFPDNTFYCDQSSTILQRPIIRIFLGLETTTRQRPTASIFQTTFTSRRTY